MVHFFFYGLTISIYTAAVFVAGIYFGEKLEEIWQDQRKA